MPAEGLGKEGGTKHCPGGYYERAQEANQCVEGMPTAIPSIHTNNGPHCLSPNALPQRYACCPLESCRSTF